MGGGGGRGGWLGMADIDVERINGDGHGQH